MLRPQQFVVRICIFTKGFVELKHFKKIHLQTFMGMRTGDIPGHEFMGVVEEVGPEVHKLKPGQRVIVGCEFLKTNFK